MIMRGTQDDGEMLKRLGYQVALAVDGNQVHSLYRQAQEAGQPYDAVIIGLTIPGDGGRNDKRLPNWIRRLKLLFPADMPRSGNGRISAVGIQGYDYQTVQHQGVK